jgi:hypothetical protein
METDSDAKGVESRVLTLAGGEDADPEVTGVSELIDAITDDTMVPDAKVVRLGEPDIELSTPSCVLVVTLAAVAVMAAPVVEELVKAFDAPLVPVRLADTLVGPGVDGVSVCGTPPDVVGGEVIRLEAAELPNIEAMLLDALAPDCAVSGA